MSTSLLAQHVSRAKDNTVHIPTCVVDRFQTEVNSAQTAVNNAQTAVDTATQAQAAATGSSAPITITISFTTTPSLDDFTQTSAWEAAQATYNAAVLTGATKQGELDEAEKNLVTAQSTQTEMVKACRCTAKAKYDLAVAQAQPHEAPNAASWRKAEKVICALDATSPCPSNPPANPTPPTLPAEVASVSQCKTTPAGGVNILTPNGPLGNAESFVWTAGAGANDNWGAARADGLRRRTTICNTECQRMATVANELSAVAGKGKWEKHTCGCRYDPKLASTSHWQCHISSVADALSYPAEESDWSKAGIQICGTGSSSQIVWIQVELPKAVSCSKTAIITSHTNSWPQDNTAFVEASTDGSTWVTAATWNTHPGSTHPWIMSAESDYSTVSTDMSTFGIDLQNSGDKFKYWRTGGHINSQSNAMLPVNWILQCTE